MLGDNLRTTTGPPACPSLCNLWWENFPADAGSPWLFSTVGCWEEVLTGSFKLLQVHTQEKVMEPINPSSRGIVIVSTRLTWQGFTAFCWSNSPSGFAESLECDPFSSTSLLLGKYFYFVLFILQVVHEFVTRCPGWGTITEQNFNT